MAVDEAKSDFAATAERIWQENENSVKLLCKARLKGRLADCLDDCMQEIFISLLKHLKAGNRLENPRAWLYRVAKNKVAGIYRELDKVAKNEIYIEDALNESSEDILFDVSYDVRDADRSGEDILDKVEAALTDEEELLILDIAKRKLSTKEIALKYGVSVSTIRRKKILLKDKIKNVIRSG